MSVISGLFFSVVKIEECFRPRLQDIMFLQTSDTSEVDQVVYPPARYVMCLFLLVLCVSGQWRVWEQSCGSYSCAGQQETEGGLKVHTQKVLSATVLFYKITNIELNFYIVLFAHEVVIFSLIYETCLIFSLTQLIKKYAESLNFNII